MTFNKLWSLASVAHAAAAVAAATSCSPAHLTQPQIPNAEILSLSADPVTGYKSAASTLDFCNVTVTYTHVGWNDTIHATVFLPFSDWNGRLQGMGGGQYAMRKPDSTLAEEVAKHYSVVATDGGHTPIMENSKGWSLDESGNVNMELLKDFAYIGLNDAAIVGKTITNSFYGHGPRYSYWSGCSTGGRQGLMLAQRYPTAFDGIVANAPAINWPSFIVAEYWPQFIMNQLNTHPPRCVLDAITAAAIEDCDENDGVKDGVISNPDSCPFDPMSIVGQKVQCNGTSVQITKNDAMVVKEAWKGLRSSDGSFLWYGLEKGTPLVESDSGKPGIAGTSCSTPGDCSGDPFELCADWISRFVLEDPSADLTQLSHKDLDTIFAHSNARYDSIIGTNNPNLTEFKQAGGKMITWHGLTDQLIFPKGSRQYYENVEALDSDVRDYYRYFEVPGIDHCVGGVGAFPGTALDLVIDWVEKGIAPDTLPASTEDGKRQDLCPYPLVSVYKGGDTKDASSYECQDQR